MLNHNNIKNDSEMIIDLEYRLDIISSTLEC